MSKRWPDEYFNSQATLSASWSNFLGMTRMWSKLSNVFTTADENYGILSIDCQMPLHIGWSTKKGGKLIGCFNPTRENWNQAFPRD